MRTALPLFTLLLATSCADTQGELPTPTPAPSPLCTPADRLCREDAALVCADDGLSWEVQPCDDGESCVAGSCEAPAPELEILTEVLPPATTHAPYTEELEVAGAQGAVSWAWTAGELPQGLEVTEGGLITGEAEDPGDYVFRVTAGDEADAYASRAFSLVVHPEAVTIITPANLGSVDEGLPMDIALEAEGGEPPYGWSLFDGALPAGVTVDSAGRLLGTPTEPGAFDFTMRVVDAEAPPGWGEGDFSLNIDLRPLVIVGENSFELLGFSIVTLPMLTIVPGIPLPYSAQLEATGGLQPYTWQELPMPGALQTLVPNGGVPDDLVLQDGGLLTGSVTDTSLVNTLSIPFTSISLTGFFFFAEVADSQNPSETAQALFLIPTLPVEVP